MSLLQDGADLFLFMFIYENVYRTRVHKKNRKPSARHQLTAVNHGYEANALRSVLFWAFVGTH